jgi:GntR family transcriptional regulator/MocR family aminotransferase
MLRQARALSVDAEDVLVTRGSQMALSLIAQSLLGPDDVVAVEALGYTPAWAALRQTGARLVAVPVDEEGLSVAQLASLCERGKIRAVYLTPHHQYPTTVQLSPSRRLELLALAERERLAIIEDDYDHEFHYEGRPLLPLKSADYAGNVVYVGTLSKVFAPGVRVGYVIAPAPLRAEMLSRRGYLDRQGDTITELALAELFEDGELARHTRRARRIYEQRREHFVELLRRQLGHVLSFSVPTGGMALWARAQGVDVPGWLSACERGGVAFQAGTQFRFDGAASPFVRLGFACLNEAELGEAVRRMRKALSQLG